MAPQQVPQAIVSTANTTNPAVAIESGNDKELNQLASNLAKMNTNSNTATNSASNTTKPSNAATTETSSANNSTLPAVSNLSSDESSVVIEKSVPPTVSSIKGKPKLEKN
jgi:hypothetical protein